MKWLEDGLRRVGQSCGSQRGDGEAGAEKIVEGMVEIEAAQQLNEVAQTIALEELPT
jgi:hypothetical protein